jgi:MscS family membrane protein
MTDFLAKTFYGNTFNEWLIALAIIAVAAVGGKILYWFFSTVVRKLTAKTETRLDDIVVNMIEEPIVLAVVFFGTWIGLQRLTFSEAADLRIGQAVQGAVVLAVTWMFVRLIDALIEEYLVPLAEKSENDLDDQLLPILRRSLKMVAWTLGIIVALNNAGFDVAALIAGLGIGGLALAMAAKDTVSNVFGGFTIFTDRPFSLGDRVRIKGFDGSIVEIGLRSTRLRTLAGTLVTIPNATFAETAVENVSAEPQRKIVLNLGLTYDTQPKQMNEAMATLHAIAKANQDLEEKVSIGFNGFGDFAMNLLFIYYISKGSDILGTQTAINLEILTRFNDQGLEFAFPTQTILHQELPTAS